MAGSSLAEARMQSDLAAAFEERIRTDDSFACRVWCALANVEWAHPEAGAPELTFREAGALIAHEVGEPRLDFYSS